MTKEGGSGKRKEKRGKRKHSQARSLKRVLQVYGARRKEKRENHYQYYKPIEQAGSYTKVKGYALEVVLMVRLDNFDWSREWRKEKKIDSLIL